MAPAPLSITVQPHPLTNLSVTSPDKTLSILDMGSYYDIESVVEGENITITISADGYQSQTIQTGDISIAITLIPNTPDISKLSNGTYTYIIRDDVAREAIDNLATVATSGSYNDLSNKPTIPTVNNATLTIQKNGTNVATFTANASGNVTANISVPNTVSSVSSSSTNADAVGAKLFYDTVGDIETALHTINSGGLMYDLSWYGGSSADPYRYSIYINSELVLSESGSSMPTSETLIGSYNTGSEVNVSLTYELPFPKGVSGYKLYVNEVNVATATSSSATINYTFTLSEDTVLRLEQV